MGVERRQKLLRRMGVATVAQNLLSDTTLTRPSAAWAWGSDQLLDEYAADELRRDHDPATGAFRGVLVEESRTNQFVSSDDFSSSDWEKDFVSVDSDVTISPNGAQDADKEVATTTDDWHRIKQQVALAAGNDAADSFYIKEAEFSRITVITEAGVGVTYDVGTDSFSSPMADTLDYGSQDVGNGWYRVYLSWNTPDDNPLLQINVLNNNGDRLYPGDGVSGLYLWRGQREHNTLLPSSPIETGGSATTRTADVLEGPFSESSGTLHFVGEHKGGDGVLWQADDGTEDNRVRLEVSGGDILFVVDDGGTNQVSLNAGTLASDGTYNLAARFDGSDFAISLDGATAVTAASGTVPSVTTQRFGRDSSVTHGINWYKTSNYRANKLTDSELEALTA